MAFAIGFIFLVGTIIYETFFGNAIKDKAYLELKESQKARRITK